MYPAPATNKKNNNINIALLTRGFLLWSFRKIAALGNCAKLLTGPFGPNRVELNLSPPGGRGKLQPDWEAPHRPLESL